MNISSFADLHQLPKHGHCQQHIRYERHNEANDDGQLEWPLPLNAVELWCPLLQSTAPLICNIRLSSAKHNWCNSSWRWRKLSSQMGSSIESSKNVQANRNTWRHQWRVLPRRQHSDSRSDNNERYRNQHLTIDTAQLDSWWWIQK